MCKPLILLPLLTALALGACSVQDTTHDTVSALTSDEPTLDSTCQRVADTGDMYRYCMEYGPQLALSH